MRRRHTPPPRPACHTRPCPTCCGGADYKRGTSSLQIGLYERIASDLKREAAVFDAPLNSVTANSDEATASSVFGSSFFIAARVAHVSRPTVCPSSSEGWLAALDDFRNWLQLVVSPLFATIGGAGTREAIDNLSPMAIDYL